MLLKSLPNCPWRRRGSRGDFCFGPSLRLPRVRTRAHPSLSGFWNSWTFLGISERKFGVLPAVGRFNTADTRARCAFASETSLQEQTLRLPVSLNPGLCVPPFGTASSHFHAGACLKMLQTCFCFFLGFQTRVSNPSPWSSEHRNTSSPAL